MITAPTKVIDPVSPNPGAITPPTNIAGSVGSHLSKAIPILHVDEDQHEALNNLGLRAKAQVPMR